MKKLLFAATIALALGGFTPALVTQAATNDQAPDYISHIEPVKVDEDSLTTQLNSAQVRDSDIPVYEISNGAMEMTNRKVAANSIWNIENTVETNSNKVFYQIGDNSYIFGNLDQVNLVMKVALLAQSNN